jgi:hypothetical protein
MWRPPSASNKDQARATENRRANRISLTGKWSTSRSATEAFAIQFNADQTFVLVYVNGTNQSRSTGTFSLRGSTLTFDGQQGFRLTGTIVSSQDGEFQFTPQNGSALRFKRSK